MNAVTMKLPMAVSANRYWRTRVVTPPRAEPFVQTYLSEDAKRFKEEVGWRAKAYGIRQPFTGRVEMHVRLYPHRPLDFQTRMRKLGDLWDDSVQCIDLGNCEKVLSDALQGIVIVDDKQFRRILLERMEPDAEGERMIVTITPIAAVQPQSALELSPVVDPQFLPPADGGAF